MFVLKFHTDVFADTILNNDFALCCAVFTGQSFVKAVLHDIAELCLLYTSKPIPEKITQLTGITNDMVQDAPSEQEALDNFLSFAKGDILVAHNAEFDTSFIKAACKRQGREFTFTYMDTVVLSRSLFKGLRNHKLDTIANHLKLGNFNHHRAQDDAEMLANIFRKMLELLQSDYGISSIAQINTSLGGGDVKKMPTYHIILLVQNLKGLRNLY